MATRSNIGIKNVDGSIKMIYCHSDGYFSHNGRKLFEHYNSLAHARELLAGGSLSLLGEQIGEKHDFDWQRSDEMKGADGYQDWDKVKADPRSKWCRFYARDREETDVGADTYPTLEEAKGHFEEFTYLWDVARNAWIVSSYSDDSQMDWHLLSDVAEADYDYDKLAKTIPYDKPGPKPIDHEAAKMQDLMESMPAF